MPRFIAAVGLAVVEVVDAAVVEVVEDDDLVELLQAAAARGTISARGSNRLTG